VFVVKIVRNTEIHCVGIVRSFLIFAPGVPVRAIVLYKFKRRKIVSVGLKRFYTSVKLSLACYPKFASYTYS
jgi:hypothetical protein